MKSLPRGIEGVLGSLYRLLASSSRFESSAIEQMTALCTAGHWRTDVGGQHLLEQIFSSNLQVIVRSTYK